MRESARTMPLYARGRVSPTKARACHKTRLRGLMQGYETSACIETTLSNQSRAARKVAHLGYVHECVEIAQRKISHHLISTVNPPRVSVYSLII